MIPRLLLLLFIAAGCGGDTVDPARLLLTVMTFNIWGGGTKAGRPVDETLAAIRKANPDIVGLQEVRRESSPCTAGDCPPAGLSVAPAIGWARAKQVDDPCRPRPAHRAARPLQ